MYDPTPIVNFGLEHGLEGQEPDLIYEAYVQHKCPTLALLSPHSSLHPHETHAGYLDSLVRCTVCAVLCALYCVRCTVCAVPCALYRACCLVRGRCTVPAAL